MPGVRNLCCVYSCLFLLYIGATLIADKDIIYIDYYHFSFRLFQLHLHKFIQERCLKSLINFSIIRPIFLI